MRSRSGIKEIRCSEPTQVSYGQRTRLEHDSNTTPETSRVRGIRCNSQLESDVRVYPIAKVLGDVLGVEIGVLDLVREVLDDFEQDDAAGEVQR